MNKITHTQKLLLVLIIQSLFCAVLVVFRNFLASENNYSFMLLNLLLAWIPLVCAYLLHPKSFPKFNLLLILIWLLFLPNAGYVLTDFLHLGENYTPVLWLDVLLLFTFGLNCLLISSFSIKLVFDHIYRKFGSMRTWIIITIFLLLASIGVYLGRFLRFNSWDLLSHPLTIVSTAIERYTNLYSHPVAWPFSLIIFIILFTNFIFIKLALESPKAS